MGGRKEGRKDGEEGREEVREEERKEGRKRGRAGRYDLQAAGNSSYDSENGTS